MFLILAYWLSASLAYRTLCRKQASVFICPINKHKDIISMNNVQGRLPEKPIRPNIAGRLAKKNKK